jgi:hypothetical protein
MRLHGIVSFLFAVACLGAEVGAQTPVTGHYPPGQSGIRGAATPDTGIAYTNFSRFFTNLRLPGAQVTHELRYANTSMFTWTTDWTLLGMRYGALAGIPVATGDLSSSSRERGFGLGDVLLTPVSLYGKRELVDYQLQLTVWTPSGHFVPGSTRNRGTGFWALVYSFGGVWYPGGARDAWSVSVVTRTEQNFEQRGSGIRPGADVVADWGIGRVGRVADHAVDVGVSGFGTWQLTAQRGGELAAESARYRLLGIGPEGSVAIADPLSIRLRAQWELGARDIVQGNNLWLIANYRF